MLADVENVVGTPFADTITGNAADNHLQGRAGADWIEGREGIDMLEGGAGTDTYSIIAGEVLNVTDIIIDSEAYNILLPNGTSVAPPHIQLVLEIALDGTGVVLATISDANTPIANLVVDVSGVDPAEINVTSTGEIIWTPSDGNFDNSASLDITVTDDTFLSAVTTIPSSAFVDSDRRRAAERAGISPWNRPE